MLQIWNLLVMISILYNFITIPLKVIYKEQFFQSEIIILNYFQHSLFLADIMLQSNISIIIKDEIITQRKLIILKYIRSNKFYYDLFSYLAFIISIQERIFNSNSQFMYLSFIFYLKNYKLNKLFKYFENQITLSQKYLAAIKLFRLLLVFQVIVHHVACLWIFVGKQNTSTNWIDSYGLTYASWKDQYLTALYFSLTTMTTVGYGDISPKNNYEKILNMIMMVLACAAFGYIINKIQNIFDELNEQKIQYRRELNIINMAKLNISQDIRMRVRNYLKMFWKSNIIQQFDKEAEVLDRLSQTLKDELTIDHLGQILQNIQILKSTFSRQFLSQLSLRMNKQTMQPDEQIVKSEQGEEQKLTFIGCGSAKILYKYKDNVVHIDNLDEGEFHGLDRMFLINKNQHSNIQIVADQFSLIYQLDRDDFLCLLKQFPQDFDRYCQIRDRYDYELKVQQDIHGRCYICSERYHPICGSVHYQPNTQWIIYKNQYEQKQVRSEVLRREKKIHNPLVNLKLIQLEQKNIQNSFSEDENSSENSSSSSGCKLFSKKLTRIPSQIILEGFEIDCVYYSSGYFPKDNIFIILNKVNKKNMIQKRIAKQRRKAIIIQNR